MLSVETASPILSFPTLLSALSSDEAPRSWIQLAKVGSWQSNRYGRFSITAQDLSEMKKNFDTVTPLGRELPIDYDHLSMDPKKPGDGVAAGWMKKLELRDEGETLWAEVEWTADAAEQIRTKGYKYISPSFVKNHTHKTGEKIGTCLLAAAVTNHPFLEGMKALTLYNFSTMGDLATPQEVIERELHLNTADGPQVGQRVTFLENETATPELSPEERAQTFIVIAIGGGAGDDAFLKVQTVEGAKPFGWYPITVFAPAKSKEQSPMAKTTPTTNPDQATVRARAELDAVINLRGGTAEAIRHLSAEAQRLYFSEFESGAMQTEQAEEEVPVTNRPMSLRRDGEPIHLTVSRVAHERCNGDFKAAYRLVAESDPAAMAAYANGETV